MESKACAKYIRISPHKLRLVANNIRGLSVESALTQLQFTPKKGARLLSKVVNSALANATQNDAVDEDALFIKRIFVDQGPTAKRWRPRAMGRATRILKKTSHVTVILDEA